jgi:hypothetical protein
VRISLGDELWFIFFERQTDGYVARQGVVTGVRGTEVQLRGMKGWHPTAQHPPAFTSKEDAEAWIAAHPFRTTPRT